MVWEGAIGGRSVARTKSAGVERGHWLLAIEDGREQGEGPLGVLPGLTLPCYLRLVECISRLVRDGRTRVDSDMASIFERLRVDAER